MTTVSFKWNSVCEKIFTQKLFKKKNISNSVFIPKLEAMFDSLNHIESCNANLSVQFFSECSMKLSLSTIWATLNCYKRNMYRCSHFYFILVSEISKEFLGDGLPVPTQVDRISTEQLSYFALVLCPFRAQIESDSCHNVMLPTYKNSSSTWRCCYK